MARKWYLIGFDNTCRIWRSISADFGTRYYCNIELVKNNLSVRTFDFFLNFFIVASLVLQWRNIYSIGCFQKQIISRSIVLHHQIYLSEENLQVQKGLGVLSRLVPCLNCRVLNGHFGPVYLLQVSKNDDEKRCF